MFLETRVTGREGSAASGARFRNQKGDLPRKPQMTAKDITISISLPSRNRASHNRSWVLKGTTFAKRVMYHFVAYDDVVTFCASYRFQPAPIISFQTQYTARERQAYENGGYVRQKQLHQFLLNAETFDQTRETRLEDRM